MRYFRVGNFKKEPNGNARGKKHCKRWRIPLMESALDLTQSRKKKTL